MCVHSKVAIWASIRLIFITWLCASLYCFFVIAVWAHAVRKCITSLAESNGLISSPHCFTIFIHDLKIAYFRHLNTVGFLTYITRPRWEVLFVRICVSKREAPIRLKPENDVLPFSMCASLPINMDSMCAMSKQDEIAVILQQELHSANQMPFFIRFVMSKPMPWRYWFEPSLVVWPVSKVVPHDRLTIILIWRESSAIPFCFPIGGPVIDPAINHKIAISLND